MADLLILVAGIVMLGAIWRDRHNIKPQWNNPSASVWSRDPEDARRSVAPSSPSMLVFGLPLGLAAVIYGVVALIP